MLTNVKRQHTNEAVEFSAPRPDHWAGLHGAFKGIGKNRNLAREMDRMQNN